MWLLFVTEGEPRYPADTEAINFCKDPEETEKEDQPLVRRNRRIGGLLQLRDSVCHAHPKAADRPEVPSIPCSNSSREPVSEAGLQPHRPGPCIGNHH